MNIYYIYFLNYQFNGFVKNWCLPFFRFSYCNLTKVDYITDVNMYIVYIYK